jgi:hypothetical protein
MELDITLPNYAELIDMHIPWLVNVSASPPTYMIMAHHLSTCIRMSHALQKKGYWAVEKLSLPSDILVADNFDKRMRDQIEMVQDIRGRIGEDRDAALDMNHRLDLREKEWPSRSSTKGKRGASIKSHTRRRWRVSANTCQGELGGAAAGSGPDALQGIFGHIERRCGAFSPMTASSSEYSPATDAEQEKQRSRRRCCPWPGLFKVQRLTAPQSES